MPNLPSLLAQAETSEENTGVIRLINGPIRLDRDKYELNVTAMDDGKAQEFEVPGGWKAP